ncbi:MAG: FAD-dependent oxidoreductase [Anaerolineales bacterium]|nr:FAD-dependent oxidoreductase [Anaerolineales bacterium]
MQIIVVGAGIAGLLAAKTLQQRGYRVMVLDKGRGVGGRMATRRIENAVFDHGAQFFSVRDARFAQWVEQWVEAGVAEVWTHGFGADQNNHSRYRGVPTMTAIPKWLAQGLDVRLNTKVTAIRLQTPQWQLEIDGGSTFQADAVVMTPPVPQSLALLDAGEVRLLGVIRTALDRIQYFPCIALMVVLDGPSSIQSPGGVTFRSEPITWMGDNMQKGVSPHASAVTIHATPDFSRTHFESDTDSIAKYLLDAARPWFGERQIVAYEVHRWRYAEPAQPYPHLFLPASTSVPMVFAGDAFGGPRIEGAALSGLGAADYLLMS